jgi:hypothetical protein
MGAGRAKIESGARKIVFRPWAASRRVGAAGRGRRVSTASRRRREKEILRPALRDRLVDVEVFEPHAPTAPGGPLGADADRPADAGRAGARGRERGRGKERDNGEAEPGRRPGQGEVGLDLPDGKAPGHVDQRTIGRRDAETAAKGAEPREPVLDTAGRGLTGILCGAENDACTYRRGAKPKLPSWPVAWRSALRPSKTHFNYQLLPA